MFSLPILGSQLKLSNNTQINKRKAKRSLLTCITHGRNLEANNSRDDLELDLHGIFNKNNNNNKKHL